MKSTKVKAPSVALIIVWCAGTIFIGGCATGQADFDTPTRAFFVMDLKTGAEYQQLLHGKPQTCGMRSGRVVVQPGQTCGEHSTKAHEELLVFLSGEGVTLIGQEQTPYEVGKGKVCYIPPHTTHNNKNTGTEPLVYIYCVAPIHDSPGK